MEYKLEVSELLRKIQITLKSQSNDTFEHIYQMRYLPLFATIIFNPDLFNARLSDGELDRPELKRSLGGLIDCH